MYLRMRFEFTFYILIAGNKARRIFSSQSRELVIVSLFNRSCVAMENKVHSMS